MACLHERPLMTPTLHRRLSRAAALTLVAGLLAACGADSGSPGTAALAADGQPDLSGVVLKVGDQVKSKQSLLEAAGELDDLPYKIEWAGFTSGPPLIEALNAGAIHVGGTGGSPAVFAQAADANVRIVAARRSTKENDFLLVGKHSGIADVKGLAGKHVAVAKGSSSHGLLVAALQDAGVPLDSVDIQFLAPPDAQSAFATARSTSGPGWTPTPRSPRRRPAAAALRRAPAFPPHRASTSRPRRLCRTRRRVRRSVTSSRARPGHRSGRCRTRTCGSPSTPTTPASPRTSRRQASRARGGRTSRSTTASSSTS